jgi:hypothetical protein
MLGRSASDLMLIVIADKNNVIIGIFKKVGKNILRNFCLIEEKESCGRMNKIEIAFSRSLQ